MRQRFRFVQPTGPTLPTCLPSCSIQRGFFGQTLRTAKAKMFSKACAACALWTCGLWRLTFLADLCMSSRHSKSDFDFAVRVFDYVFIGFLPTDHSTHCYMASLLVRGLRLNHSSSAKRRYQSTLIWLFWMLMNVHEYSGCPKVSKLSSRPKAEPRCFANP